MLKISQNALGMLIAKYKSVLKNMRLKNAIPLAAACLLFCAAPAFAAVDYTSGGTTTSYNDLEDLRQNVAVFNHGNIITVHIDDNSLTEPLNFWGSNVTIDFQNKYITINPNTSGRFIEIGYDEPITFANAANAVISGFNSDSIGGAIFSGGNVTIGGGNISFTGNHAAAVSQDNGAVTLGGAIYGNAVVINGNADFTDNYAAAESQDDEADAYGGAIFSNNEVNISGNNASFADNHAIGESLSGSANAYGGAIFSNNAVNISGNNASFSGNYTTTTSQAGFSEAAGGAIYGYEVNVSGNNSSFTDNSAFAKTLYYNAYAYGGAIYGYEVNVSGNNSSFTYNSAFAKTLDYNAYAYGGAILGYEVNISGNNISFTGNSASAESINSTAFASGGAIYGVDDVIVAGDNISFINNSAVASGTNAFAYGGAIYADTNLTIRGGDIVFRDNKVIETGADRANAVYMQNNGSNTTLTLAALDGKTISFYDPVESNEQYQDLTININKTENAKTYTGTVLFNEHHSQVFGYTTVHNGTMQLANGAIYGAANDVGTFTLNTGATLLAGTGGNEIQAGTITLKDKSILSFDLTGAVAENTLNLTLNSQNGGNISKNVLIDIKSPGGVGTFNLVTAAGGVDASFNNSTNFTLRGYSIAGTRLDTANTKLSVSTDNKTLQLETDAQNGVVKWTGGETNVWNATGENWEGQDTSSDLGGADLRGETRFLHGDAVIFNDAAGGQIIIQDNGVQIAARPDGSGDTNPGMVIEDGGWTFTGGKIEGGEILFAGNGGSIAFDTRSLEQRIIVADDVTAGIAALDGEVLTFNRLGVAKTDDSAYGGAVYGGDGSTIELGGAGQIVFQNNYANSVGTSALAYGGAIYGRNVVISGTNATFTGNSAAAETQDGYAAGGAIYGYDVNISGTNATFTGNYAAAEVQDGYAYAAGGAIYGYDVVISGTNATFTSNYAAAETQDDEAYAYGGAIFSRGTVSVEKDNISFTNNFAVASGAYADARGGAIYGYDVNISGTNATFTGNYAVAESQDDEAYAAGGAIYGYDVNISGTNATFTGNYAAAEVQDGDADAYGGAIYGGNVVISGTNATFTGNYAAAETQNDEAEALGGAIYGENAVAIDGTNATFTGNYAAAESQNDKTLAYGGAIFSRGNVTVEKDNISFTNNFAVASGAYAEASGGAISGYEVNISGTNATFTGNYAAAESQNDEADARGGAIYGRNEVNIIGTNATFTGNYAAAESQNDEALAYGGAISSWKDVTVEGDNISFTNNSAVASVVYADAFGGAIYSKNEVTIDGVNASFTGNSAVASGTSTYASGGAIHGDYAVTIDGTNATFTDNYAAAESQSSSATARGGAIYGWNEVNISGDNATFTGNYADAKSSSNDAEAIGGAILSWDKVIVEGDNISFINNYAVASGAYADAYGGAIYSDYAVTIDGTNATFTDNYAAAESQSSSATARGGAIYGWNEVNISGDNTSFTGNYVSAESSSNDAEASGGAIFSWYDVTIAGDNISFTNNSAVASGASADARGGAIYADTNLTIRGGDIVFQGNKVIENGADRANAVYMQNSGDTTTLTLAALDGKTISFYDPVESNEQYQDLTININKTENAKTYTGTVLFDTHHSQVFGYTTVYNGTMALANGAIYGAANDIGTFTLNAGATLLADAKGNTINADTITLAGDSILSFDLRGAVAGGTPNLTLDSQNDGDISTDVTIDIKYLGGTGTFNLVTTTNGTVAGDTNLLTIRGEEIGLTRLDTANNKLYLSPDDNKTLQFKTDVQNGVVTWTGGDNGDWNATGGNWAGEVDSTPVTKFLHGDAVIFDGSGGVIDVQLKGVQIAARGTNPGMVIENGDWTFSGGSIDGDGRLAKNGTGTLTLASANRYTGGTTISQGTLLATDKGALGVGAVAIYGGADLSLEFNGEFKNELMGDGTLTTGGNIFIDRTNDDFNGTVNINTDRLTLKQAEALGTSQININPDAALEFNLNPNNSGSFHNEINNNEGTLIKSGAGELTLTNTNNNYAGGTTAIEGGILNVTGSGGLTFGNIHNASVLNFISPPLSSTKKNIDITGEYSGSGVIGLEASLTASAQWVDKMTFTNNPANDVTVKFYFKDASDIKNMPADNNTSMIFASLNDTGISFRLADPGAKNLIGSHLLSVKTDNDQDFYLDADSSPGGSKVYSKFSAAALAQAAEMHNQEFFKAIPPAGDSGDNNSPGVYLGYGRLDFKQDTGSHADIKGNRITLGVAWKANDKTAWGIFGQKFNGSYRTETDIETGGQVHSDGDSSYHDIGLFAEYRPNGQEHNSPGHYYQATIKAGRSSSDFRADNFQGNYSTFHSNRSVFGLSLGGGYIKNRGENNTLEYYSHLIYTGLGSDSVTDSIGQNITLNSADSLKLLSGARYNFNKNKKTSTYAGAALDWEFSGRTSDIIDGYKAPSANLSGLTGILELGLTSKQSETLTIDCSLKGLFGKKKGFAGNLMLVKRF